MAPPPRDWRELLHRPGCPWDYGRLQEEVRDGAWELRASAWDTHLNRERLRVVADVVKRDARQMARDQLEAAADVRALGHEEVKRLRAKFARTPDHGGGIRPETAIRAVVQGIQAERLIMGQTTDLDQPDQGVEDAALDVLTLEELRTFQALQAKLEQARQRKVG